MSVAPQTPSHQMRMDSPMSDYFTDPSNSPDILIKSPSSTQQEILRRLQSLGDWVLRQELSSHTATKAHLVLNELQDVLVAPDPQSRQPADIDESDLFSAEDEVEADDSIFDVAGTEERPNTSVLQTSQKDDIANRYDGINFRNKKLLEESQEVLMRISAATQKLQMRYQEVKDSNDIAQEVIEQSTREIMRLRSDYERVSSDASFNHYSMLQLKSRLDMLEANATSLTNNENYHACYPDLTSGIESWKADWNSAYETLHRRELQRNGVTQKMSTPCNAFSNDDYQLSTKSDLEPSIGYDSAGEGICACGFPMKIQVEEELQAQCKKARATNTPARDDNDTESTCTIYFEHDSLAPHDKGCSQQSQLIAARNTANSLSPGSQIRNSDQKTKPSNWAKLWDQLAELAGIYDY